MTAACTLRIGPIDRLPEIDDLCAALEDQADLAITSRLFRAGLYHLDGSCADLRALAHWLQDRADVLAVRLKEATIYVVPAVAGS